MIEEAISNASHFHVLFCCLYDEAIFYTNEGHLETAGKIRKIFIVKCFDKKV